MKHGLGLLHQDEEHKASLGVTSKETEHPGPIPPDIIALLPTSLRKGVGYIDSENAKSVFLTGAFPVLAGCMPNVRIVHRDGPISLNLYTMTVAAAGAGKGVLRYARRLGTQIDEFLNNTSKEKRFEWRRRMKESKSRDDIGPEPPLRSFFLAGNSSHRALIDSLQANRGQGVILESELLTVLIAGKNEWGNYRDILLSNSHGETITLNRRGGESIRVESPSVSVAFTGTHSAYKRMFPSMEDGLFSRFNFFTFSEPFQWQSQRPGKEMEEREKFFNDQAVHLLNLYQILESRSGTLYIRLEDDQWNYHDTAFAEELNGIPSGSDFGASVRRAGITAVRTAAILTVLRHGERSTPLSAVKSMAVNDADLQIGVEIARLWLAHARFLQKVREPVIQDLIHNMTEEQRRLFLGLSEFTEFRTAQAKQMARELGLTVSDRTIENWLAGGMPGFIRISHGLYKTVRFGLSESSVSSESAFDPKEPKKTKTEMSMDEY